MAISEFTFRIILLFIPGLITFYIVEILTIHKEYKLHDKMLLSLLYGFISYSFYYLITLIKTLNLKFSFIETLTDNAVHLDFREILITALLSIPIGFFLSFIINYGVINTLARKLKISKKFGDIGVWSFLMNSKIPTEWVVIRDIEHDLMYEGWIQAFSDVTEEYEVFLRDVKVFKNKSGEFLYETPGLYLPRKREYLVVEFPRLEYTKYIEMPNKKEESEDGSK